MALLQRIIQTTLIAGIMAFLMTAVITYINLGLPADFIGRWMLAFAIAWPFATIAAFIAVPLAQRATARIMAMLEG